MSSKANRKSASKWEQSGERALIEIWGEKMGDFHGCRKNSHVLQEMVAVLQTLGFKYTVCELKAKMHNMTQRYRKEKQKIGSTGGSPSDWDLFKEMDVLLAPYKSYNCQGLVVDCITHMNSPLTSTSIAIDSPLPNTSTEPPSTDVPSTLDSPLPNTSTEPPSTPTDMQTSGSAAASSSAARRRKWDEKFLNNIREDMKISSERLFSIEEEKKNILKGYVEREAEVQKALVEFLKRP